MDIILSAPLFSASVRISAHLFESLGLHLSFYFLNWIKMAEVDLPGWLARVEAYLLATHDMGGT